ncbi:MAG: sulfatase [Planctomycetaceae bacterium]|nr:sulfatase [Planctomycetaceae bacterium]
MQSPRRALGGRLRFLLCIVLLLSAGISHAAERLNVVLFVADDLGWMDLGCQGSSFYETPNLDRLAAQGMRFTNAYAACPVCSPTRASLQTGRWPQRTGITDYIGAAQPDKWKRDTTLLPAPYSTELAHNETTLAEALRANGYATMFAGKWHLGGEAYWPEHQGFDINRGGIDRGGPYGGKKYFSPYGNPRLEDGTPGEHIADRLADECGKFIEAHQDEPFFVNYCFYDVHTPLMAKPELVAKYQAKRTTDVAKSQGQWPKEGVRPVRQVQDHAVYAGMVETMDGAVGTVLAKLDELKLADRTLVLFTSDNGGLSTSEGWPTSNLPLRGGKGWLYEGGIRVPCIVRWPGVTKAGSESDRVVVSPDLFATVLDAAGLPASASAQDSVSLVPTLKGESQPPRPASFWHYPHYGNQGGFPGAAVRDGNWKLIERYEDDSLELYDLSADISEQKNLVEQQPEIVARLKRQLDAWRTDVGAKFPTRRNQ